MSQTLDELLLALVAAGADEDAASLIDEIEGLVEDDPEGSRAAVWSYAGDEGMRLRLIGFLGDPRDFDLLAAHLADPRLRHTALEALANQPDAERADAVARSLLDDADPRVRSRAAGMVAFWARPGALDVLLPLADDPAPHVRMVLGWHLGGLRDRAAEPTLLALLEDPDEQVREFAARGLARMHP
ncbi:HEAT repeat domain-containing protein [Dactylosporangium sp. NPDC000244]|uniref:HEAT repeat domain-containing protein n=1 Tax=Dactylosporangium sp. NPDC000244 TaxID=3154365 RepID=UPI00333327AE